jgi:hypothetical protein
VLADVKAGRITLDRLEVEGFSWTVKPPLPVQQVEPITVNDKAD